MISGKAKLHLRKIFEHPSKQGRSIIFVDEIDVIARIPVDHTQRDDSRRVHAKSLEDLWTLQWTDSISSARYAASEPYCSTDIFVGRAAQFHRSRIADAHCSMVEREYSG
jgi:hypothetical protein